jgi:hypothetical protein
MFRPRDYCNVPEEFGRSSGLRFKPHAGVHIDNPRTSAERKSNLDNVVFAALAHRQNEWALAMRRLLISRKLTIGAYARSIGEGQKTLSRKLCGETVMDIKDGERMEQSLGGFYKLLRIRAGQAQALVSARRVRDAEAGIFPSLEAATVPDRFYFAAKMESD